jgi:uncharacterized protein (DUF952 family)
MLIFKIVPRREWEMAGEVYSGSAHDRADGFLHFSTASQLPVTLQLYYAGQSDLVLIAVESDAVAADLKFEYAPSRGEDFPHLFAALPRSAVKWVRPIGIDGDRFVLPQLD